ncbi:MAG: hypothetical protein R3F56_01435 [Planctomycetota bacterium]
MIRALLFPAVLALPSHLSAQVSQIPRTGCGGSAVVSVQGQPRIGQRLSFGWACRGGTALPVLLFEQAVPVAYVPAPLACAVGGCGSISLLPRLYAVGVAGQALTVAVVLPPDPSLVGFTFHAQGACVSRTCLDLGIGVAVRIMR